MVQNSSDTNNTPPAVPFWYDPQKRMLAYQALALLAVFFCGYIIFTNTQANIARQSIATGFGFLWESCSFDISESLISYSAADTYAKAFLVGILNTLKVSVVGTFLALALGLFVGIARLSSNWLVAKLAALYIDVMQNIPTLLQLFFWYAIFYQSLPGPRQALNPTDGVFLCNRGLMLPLPESNPAFFYMLIAMLLGLLTTILVQRWAKARQDATGKPFPVFSVGNALVWGLPLLVWLGFGAPMTLDMPHLKGFNFRGGITISPEFISLLIGLVMYTGAFIAEVVRAGIEAVNKGQIEAAKALGLKKGKILRLIVIPQAMRIIIPPLTSQMLNLTKNSSLAVGIGYPDFFSITNTAINQTGQAIEGVIIIMLVYLTFSLSTSAFMNWYNKRAQLIER
ncbi:amino acid ABC transporter permease [Dethiosulfatarculus sandiegensis]|uniref:ABC transporter permease n=1 Tax=Dethiosulfatarculus sandiegensis TaxID=1429043 RepID=A0A0D2JNN8_9BACT|nr:amino acid ABC transporter permease [Dethiosulfatarculus sandiegensis]KIX11105.1 ABC transporter permease [Dethiosulfatarculus sandiegensis]